TVRPDDGKRASRSSQTSRVKARERGAGHGGGGVVTLSDMGKPPRDGRPLEGSRLVNHVIRRALTSVVASLPAEHQVESPAAADVRAWPGEVPEEVGVRAASFLQGVGQDGEAVGVQVAARG